MALWNKKQEKEKTNDARKNNQASLASPLAHNPQQGSARAASRTTGKVLGVLRMPHRTEKTADSEEKNRTYAFMVSGRANKIMVKAAVERNYGVAVSAVRMLNTPEKARVRGRIIGWKQGFKKAMVTVKKGQKIEIS